MKRDWDIIRDLLLKTENLNPNETLSLKDFETNTQFEISYHVQLLESAGLINASISNEISQSPTHFFLRSLTWEGHEFLDSIRVKSTWQKVKSIIAEKGGVMTFDVIKTVATTLVKSSLV